MDQNTPSNSDTGPDDADGDYPTEGFIDAIEDADGKAGTRRSPDEVGCSHETAAEKLRALEAAGRVASQEIANARAWQTVDQNES